MFVACGYSSLCGVVGCCSCEILFVNCCLVFGVCCLLVVFVCRLAYDVCWLGVFVVC